MEIDKEKNEFEIEIDEYINDAVELDDFTYEDPVEQEKHVLYVRSKAVKELLKDYENSVKYIKRNYKKELNFSKENRFQSMNWIKKNKGIQKNLERYPLLIPLLDYLFNMTRRGITQKRIDEMYALTGTQKLNGNPYACFVADDGFYTKITKTLNISKRQAQRYLKGLESIDAIRILRKLEHNIKVYADGFYTPYMNGYKKDPLLIDDKSGRNGLKTFTPLQ